MRALKGLSQDFVARGFYSSYLYVSRRRPSNGKVSISARNTSYMSLIQRLQILSETFSSFQA